VPSKSGALQPGDAAPPFRAPSVCAGQVETFELQQALKERALVLYFFPKAFTAG